MKSFHHSLMEISKFCYTRGCKAKTREAMLWWVNRHYEVNNKIRLKEQYGGRRQHEKD